LGLGAKLTGKGEISFDTVKTNQEGYFIFSDLPAGRYNVFKYGNYNVRIVDLYEGQDYILDWDAPGIATLQGYFMSDNLPIEEVSVRGYSEDEKISVASAITRGDGSYRMELPFLGKYTISFSKGSGLDYIRQKREIEIKPGLNKLDLILGSAISGRVVFEESGEPAGDANLQAYKKERNPFNSGNTWDIQFTEPQWFMKSRCTTDENGVFKVKNTDPGEWLILYFNYGEEPLDRITIPSKPFFLDEKDQEKKVLFKVPETTLLRLDITDKDNGESLKGITVNAINQDRYIFSPCRWKVEGDNSPYPEHRVIKDEEDRILFGKLPPGKYRMFSNAHGYYPISSAEFEIPEKEKQDPEKEDLKEEEPEEETVDLKFELEKGGRVVFRLPDSYKSSSDNIAYVVYHLSDPKEGGQVLENQWGLYWGEHLDFPAMGRKEAVLVLHPGKYVLHVTLRERSSGFSATRNTTDIWAYTSEVTIEKNKDFVINIDMGIE
jgi:hypothetical protein